ncbi:hypothetical protein BSKO_11857 [Bryopsis sp. KO-2023]|nr:hypothetical protein BSKO_11857 [Bryopsis sp. KO-2023]
MDLALRAFLVARLRGIQPLSRLCSRSSTKALLSGGLGVDPFSRDELQTPTVEGVGGRFQPFFFSTTASRNAEAKPSKSPDNQNKKFPGGAFYGKGGGGADIPITQGKRNKGGHKGKSDSRNWVKRRRKARENDDNLEFEDFGVLTDSVDRFKTIVASRRASPLAKERCAKEAMEHVDSTGIVAISVFLHCCARGGYLNSEFLECMVKRALSTPAMMVQIPQSNTLMLFQAMAGFSKCKQSELEGFPSRHKFTNALVEVTRRQERGRFMESSEHMLTTIMQCTGVLFKQEYVDARLGKGLINAIMNRMVVEGRITRSTPSELANLLYGCASVGFVGMSDIRKVCDQLQCLLVVPHNSVRIMDVSFTGSILSSIIWSLGKLGMSDGLRMDSLGEEVVKQLGKMSSVEVIQVLHGFVSLGYGNEEVVDKVCLEVTKPTRLITLETQELTNALYGLARLGYEPDMLDGLVSEISRPKRLRELSRIAICTVVQSIGHMGNVDEKVLHSLLDESLEPGRLESMGEQIDRHLCSFVFGLGLLREKIDEEKLHRVIRPFLDKVRIFSNTRHLTCHDVASMSWGLSKLQFYDRWFMDRMVNQFMRAIATKNSSNVEKDFLKLLHACAVLNHKNVKFMDFAMERIEAYTPSLTEVRSLTGMIWGCAVLGRLTPGLFANLSSRIVLLGGINRRDDAMQFLQGWWLVSREYLKTKRDPDDVIFRIGGQFEEVISGLVESTKGVLEKHPEHSGVSEFEREVTGLIESLTLPNKKKVLVKEGLGLEIDCLVEGDPPIAVEADGHSHYTINVEASDRHRREMGPTAFRNTLLESLGYKVVSVPYFLWNRLDEPGKIEWLTSKMA